MTTAPSDTVRGAGLTAMIRYASAGPGAYGSELRTDVANIGSESPYAQFNVRASHEFAMPDGKPLTVRFDIVNLFDTIYQIKSGTGIGFCSAIRPAPRLFHRREQENLMQETRGSIWNTHSS